MGYVNSIKMFITSTTTALCFIVHYSFHSPHPEQISKYTTAALP